ncbi:MAG: MBL fold metallo-hydrolase [Actinobacteria bacterium]|nr:MAG: MBL fold metallo-hydrolase [Actinomycetota bacterium]
MELIVLGAGGGWARPGGAASGYLVRADGFNLWIDLGTGTLANLQRHVGITDVDAVIVSHRHFDHFLDVYPFYLARWYGTDQPPIPLFAPPGMFEHALPLEQDLPRAFQATVIEPGDGFEAGPFRVRTAPMRHPVPTLGMRLECEGRALAYSADTGTNDELVRLAAGADVLLAEATWIEPPSWAEPIHMTASETGEAARRAGAARLVVTHVWPENPREVVRERAGAAFGGDVELAVEGMRVEL